MHKKFYWTLLTAFILLGQSNVLLSMNDEDESQNIPPININTISDEELNSIASTVPWTHADIEDEKGYETGWAYNGYEEGETNPPGN